MAPRKRKAGGEEQVVKPPGRVTRSSTRRANANLAADSMAEIKPESPKKKSKKGRKTKKEKVKETEKEEPETENASEKENASENLGVDESNKTIVIEHCKQCNSFKTRAIQVKNGLENDVPGITVQVNPEKPRRGCFEIREEGGETFISLLGMKRPFEPMKELDMEKVISDIIDKIK